jgi:hypothetical protein
MVSKTLGIEMGSIVSLQDQAQLWCSRLHLLSHLAGFEIFAECLRVLSQRFGHQSAKTDLIDSELLSLPGVQVEP